MGKEIIIKYIKKYVFVICLLISIILGTIFKHILLSGCIGCGIGLELDRRLKGK